MATQTPLTSDTLIDDYALARIDYRVRQLAERFSLPQDQREDCRHDMVVELLSAFRRFNPDKAKRETFINRVLDLFVKYTTRVRCTHRRRPSDNPIHFDDIAPGYQPVINDPPTGELGEQGRRELRLDMDTAVARTSDGDYEQAARSLRHLGYGGDCGADIPTGVDISGIVGMSAENADCATNNANNGDCAADVPEITDPGPIPEHMFHIPGLVAQVMDFTLANAPYPNVGLAFCGAMALQSYLCGRKVCTTGDLRPNLYLLALASSGTGKDFPRKVNSRVLFEIGHVAALGDKFASGEGIQDALLRTSAMLFQNDEMDGVLRQINLDRENRRESIPNILLTLYTSANDVYPIRVKAGQKEAAHIDQPHLTLFGTATPQYFYESLSQRMLTNGFFARLMIVDIGKRGEGQKPGSARHLPDEILDTARWWAEYQPGTTRRNLLEVHPEPIIVPSSPEAEKAITALQRQTEAEYSQAHERNDEVARVAWSRTCENAKKLAMLYACSENHESPTISLPGVEWATAFAMHQTRRQLFLAASYVAENPFHAECLKLLRKLREAPGQQLAHSTLLKRMKMKTKDFRELMETLVQRGDVESVASTNGGRPGVEYRLNAGGEERGEIR